MFECNETLPTTAYVKCITRKLLIVTCTKSKHRKISILNTALTPLLKKLNLGIGMKIILVILLPPINFSKFPNHSTGVFDTHTLFCFFKRCFHEREITLPNENIDRHLLEKLNIAPGDVNNSKKEKTQRRCELL